MPGSFLLLINNFIFYIKFFYRGPDWSTAIKGISNTKMVEHRYTYAKAGTYKAVFVASNSSIDNEKKVVKEITLTITP